MFGPLRLTTTDKVAAATRSVASTVTFVAAVFLTLILGGRWVVFADGSSGGAARNGYAGEFWSTAVAPSNVGLAVAVTVVAVAVTVVYSHR